RFSNHGTIIGFFGEPSRPMVDAMGIPSSMCVAWMSPFDSESRMAAQLAPLLTVELMPYFLNSPFSCAMTIGEQSVRAIMPNFMAAVSGASLAKAVPTQPLGRPPSNAVTVRPFAARPRNCRRENSDEDVFRWDFVFMNS